MGNILVVRKLADRSGGTQGPPWPLAGVQIDDPPQTCAVPTRWVNHAIAEGWAELEGAEVKTRPAGPAHNPGGSTHQFIHADALVLHTVDGDLRYRITHQPDKYVADGDDDTPMTSEHYAAGNTRVDWWYGLEREA